MSRISPRIVSIITWLGLVSCSDEIALIGHFHARRDASIATSDMTDVAEGGSAPNREALVIEPGGRAQYCAGSGSAVRVLQAAASQSCGPGIGRRLFRYGVCACGDLSVTQRLSTFTLDAFDSRDGAFAASESGGALGIGGLMRVGNVAVVVNGSAVVAGHGEMPLNTTIVVSVAADLKTNATIDAGGGGVLSVGRDLWADADVIPGLTSNVMRDVYQTPGHVGADGLVGAVNRQTRNFSIAPPCACEVDIAALVAEAQRTNDNAELGVSATELSDMLQQGKVPPELACGRFILGASSLPEDVLRTLRGRLALFIAGDLTLQGNFASDLTPGAELDVFVSGNLIVRDSVQIGAPERPSAVRLYIGGTRAIELNDRLKFAAQIYAPRAPVKVAPPVLGAVENYGSIVAASFDITAFFTLHYDRAMASVDDRCDDAPPLRCDSCEQCPSGLACVDGSCAACRTDADCCDPFGCSDGRCQPLIYSAPMR